MTVLLSADRVDIEAELARIAARQHGAFSRAQALDLGIAETTLRRRVRSGRWQRPFPGVYRIAGSPLAWLGEVWNAYLAVGLSAVVTHESSLHLHGIHLQPRRPITLTVAHGQHRQWPGVFVHQIDDLLPNRITRKHGLPVSTPERAVVEVAATLGRKRLADVLDEAVAAKQTSYARVAASMREVARPGKPGMAKLGDVLDERAGTTAAPASVLERALLAALSAAGLPRPRCQFPLPGRGALDGLVDAAFPDARLIVEADGRRWHTRIRDLKRDKQRDVEAARVGWQTLRFTYEEIIDDPAGTAESVADVLARRIALLSE